MSYDAYDRECDRCGELLSDHYGSLELACPRDVPEDVRREYGDDKDYE